MTLMHLVDSILLLEGDKTSSLRLLRVMKNRFGPADEVACFEQEDDGMRQVVDPSGMFSTHRTEPQEGVCPTIVMEGKRALIAELQALIASTNSPNPRRGQSGVDSARTAMLIAVTEKHGKVRLYDKDSFVATVGGMKVSEPAADLAICLAIASAASGDPLPLDVCAIG
jgi:DNA repair protein RadA/Sms